MMLMGPFTARPVVALSSSILASLLSLKQPLEHGCMFPTEPVLCQLMVMVNTHMVQMIMFRLNIHRPQALQLLEDDFQMCLALEVSQSVLKVRQATTADPIVDPDQFGRRRRRRRGSSSASHGPVRAPLDPVGVSADSSAQFRGDGNSELLSVMKQLLSDKKKKKKKKYDGRESSWTSARGPAPGVRWRGGAAPTPPKLQYQQNDLRASSKFERKVQTWVLQSKNHMTHHMTPSEMGLALYVSRQGGAEPEAEHFDLKRVKDKDGVQHKLRGPLQQGVLFQKRKLLSDFETVKRTGQEPVRQYLNRHRRTHRARPGERWHSIICNVRCRVSRKSRA